MTVLSEKNLGISILLDHYGPMLTDKQRDVIDLYYNQDLSLTEIAQEGKTFPVECQFCDKIYEFTPQDIEKILENV